MLLLRFLINKKGENKMSKTEIKDNVNNVTVTLDGDTGDITAGGNGKDGDISLRNADGAEKIHLDGQTGSITAKIGRLIVFNLKGDTGEVLLHGIPLPNLDMNSIPTQGPPRIRLDPSNGDIDIGGHGRDGDLIVRNTTGTERIHLDGQTGSITAGSAALVMVFSVNGDSGEVVLRGVNVPGQGMPRIRLEPDGANIWIGGNGQSGNIALFSKEGDNKTLEQAKIHLNAESGEITLGATLIGSGAVLLKNSLLKEVIRIDSVKSPSPDPNLIVFGEGGRIVVKNFEEKDSIILDGNAGDIVLNNADCAEDFDVPQSEGVEPGTVVVIDEEGKMRPSRVAYDKKVAGVISGAGSHRPGLILDKKSSQADRLPVALMGKVYCKADAQYAAIETGDLLTTSPTPGHAMRADDPVKAFGSVIGKAMRPLKTGQGLIPILIALQ